MLSPVGPPALDGRDGYAVARDVLARRSGYLPDWLGGIANDDPDRLPSGPDAAYVWVLARYVETLIQRLEQAPDKNRLAFLEAAGIELIPAQSARAPVVFRMASDAPDHHLPAGTRLMAPPPPESGEQVAFEVERGTGLASARLRRVASLWPGRDQYIDHTPALEEGRPFHPFRLSELEDTPHHLYIAHDRLLALSGTARVDIELELARPSTEPLDIVWEYWDGEVWRGFRAAHPLCAEDARADGTGGLVRSGVVRLESDCAESRPTEVAGIASSWIRGRIVERILPGSPIRVPEVAGIRVSTTLERPIASRTVVDDEGRPAARCGAAALEEDPSVAGGPGLLPDLAVAAGSPVELTEPFFPLGERPAPGSTFYFALDEALARKGARVTVCVTTARTPEDDVAIATEEGSAGVLLTHLIAWEFWDGSEWRPLFEDYENPSAGPGEDPVRDPRDFTGDGLIEFTVPDAIRPVEVDGEEACWVRVRLLSGGYGFTQKVTWLDTAGAGDPVRHSFTYVITRPPSVRDFRIGFTWQDGPYEPTHVVAYNDFRFEDNTDDAKWEGSTFTPYRPVRDVTPALYLGFDRALPVSRLGFFFDVHELPDATSRPDLAWEYWDGSAWLPLSTEDGTRHLAATGLLSFIGPGDSEPAERFGAALHWIRGRQKEDGPPGTTEIRALHPNAAWAVQRETLTNEPLGAASGLPDQVVTFPHLPILAGELIEIRELEGARANVEWRILAARLLGGDLARVRALEERLGEEGPALELVEGDLRLVRDREKRVIEAWVRWRPRRHLYDSGPDDRHYVIERARGRVRFGDGARGRIPPARAAIMARRYQTGGGRRGNVPARSINQAAAGLGGVEELYNPIPAAGGAEAETARGVANRGPRTIRHRGRAVRGADYETMAREASAAVAVARVLPLRDPSGRRTPGWVSLLVIPESSDPRPWPSYQLREHVRRYIAERAGPHAGTTGRLHVVGPLYHPVDVRAEVVPLDPAEAGPVEAAARAAIERFLHPLRGGPAGQGWTLGRDVFLSDVAALIERVPGVDHVRELALLAQDIAGGERLRVPDGRVVAAGDVSILLRS